jgi:hypothetical protein
LDQGVGDHAGVPSGAPAGRVCGGAWQLVASGGWDGPRGNAVDSGGQVRRRSGARRRRGGRLAAACWRTACARWVGAVAKWWVSLNLHLLGQMNRENSAQARRRAHTGDHHQNAAGVRRISPDTPAGGHAVSEQCVTPSDHYVRHGSAAATTVATVWPADHRSVHVRAERLPRSGGGKLTPLYSLL